MAPVSLPLKVDMPAEALYSCEQQMLAGAMARGRTRYMFYIDSVRTALTAQLRAHLMATATETLTVTRLERRLAYTLYTYDRAGNLASTVPPAGVAQLHPDSLPLVAHGHERFARKTSVV